MRGRSFWRRIGGLLAVAAGTCGIGSAGASGNGVWPPAALVDVSSAASADADSLRRHPDRVAQRVRVTGVAPGAAGRTVRWRVAADPLSGLSWEVDRAPVGADGSFSLQGMFRETMPTTLEIDYYSGILFVTPGADYRLRFHPYDYTLDRRLNVFFPGAPVPSLTFDLEAPAAERLNRGIWQFLTLYGREIDEAAYEAIAIHGQTQAVSRLQVRVDSLAAAWPPPETARDTAEQAYVMDYWRYQMAGLEEFAGMKSGKALFRDYVRDAPLQYRQPAQQQFARGYFGAYFEAGCPIPEKRLKALLAGADVQAVLDTLGVDAALVNRQWREWVYIMAVAEVLGKPGYPAAALERQLAQLAGRTVYPMHRQTIAGLLENRRRQREGIGLKPYVWTDMQGRAVAADTLLRAGHASDTVDAAADTVGGSGQPWTYLCLVKSDPTLSPDGAAQVYALAEALRQDAGLRAVGRGIVLVCDDDSAAARTYVRALQAALQPPAPPADVARNRRQTACDTAAGRLSFYHFNREIENLRDWGIYTFPAFVLVSPDGRLHTRFAPPLPDGLNWWRRLIQSAVKRPETAPTASNPRRNSGSGRR